MCGLLRAESELQIQISEAHESHHLTSTVTSCSYAEKSGLVFPMVLFLHPSRSDCWRGSDWRRGEALGLLLDLKCRNCFSLIKCHAVLTMALVFLKQLCWKVSSASTVPRESHDCSKTGQTQLWQSAPSQNRPYGHTVYWRWHDILFHVATKVCSWMQCRLRCLNNDFIIDFSSSNTFILYPHAHSDRVSGFLYSCIQRCFYA